MDKFFTPLLFLSIFLLPLPTYADSVSLKNGHIIENVKAIPVGEAQFLIFENGRIMKIPNGGIEALSIKEVKWTGDRKIRTEQSRRNRQELQSLILQIVNLKHKIRELSRSGNEKQSRELKNLPDTVQRLEHTLNRFERVVREIRKEKVILSELMDYLDHERQQIPRRERDTKCMDGKACRTTREREANTGKKIGKQTGLHPVIRSALLPGWGQQQRGEIFKGGALFLAHLSVGTMLFTDHRAYYAAREDRGDARSIALLRLAFPDMETPLTLTALVLRQRANDRLVHHGERAELLTYLLVGLYAFNLFDAGTPWNSVTRQEKKRGGIELRLQERNIRVTGERGFRDEKLVIAWLFVL